MLRVCKKGIIIMFAWYTSLFFIDLLIPDSQLNSHRKIHGSETLLVLISLIHRPVLPWTGIRSIHLSAPRRQGKGLRPNGSYITWTLSHRDNENKGTKRRCSTQTLCRPVNRIKCIISVHESIFYRYNLIHKHIILYKNHCQLPLYRSFSSIQNTFSE